MAALVKKTGDGTIKWNATAWGNDGNPYRWRANRMGCEFYLDNRSNVGLSVKAIGRNQISVGQGVEVQKLVEAVAKASAERGATKDEVLNHVLACLQE